MKRLTLILLAAFALLACAPSEDVAEGPRTQLVTEDYLRRQLDIKTAHLWGQVAAELLTGNLATDDFGEHLVGTPAAPRVTGAWADTDWPNNRRVYVEFEITGSPYRGNWYRLEIDFKGPDYNTAGGSVVTGRVPPAAGRRGGHHGRVHHDREPARHPDRAPDIQDRDRDHGILDQPDRVAGAVQRRHGRGRHGRGEGVVPPSRASSASPRRRPKTTRSRRASPSRTPPRSSLTRPRRSSTRPTT